MISSANWCANCRRLLFGGVAVIHAADHGGRGGIFHVVEPGLDLQVVPFAGEIAEGQKLRGDRRIAPRRVVQFRRHARHLRGVEALAGDVHDAAEVQIVAHHVAEKRGEWLDVAACAKRNPPRPRAGLRTPRPVPVRNQSCAAAGAAHCKATSVDSTAKMATARQAPNRFGVKLVSVLNFSLCAFSVPLRAQGKIDFAAVWRSYRLKSNQNSTDTLFPLYSPGSGFSGFEPWIGPHRRAVHRGVSAGLQHLDVGDGAVAQNVKRHHRARRKTHRGIDGALQPVAAHAVAHCIHVPGEASRRNPRRPPGCQTACPHSVEPPAPSANCE